jgi:hypothetical protein
VHVGKVLGLETRGWRRTAVEYRGFQRGVERELPGGVIAAITLDPGIVVSVVDEFPDQTLYKILVRQWDESHWRTVRLGELDPILASEILRDLHQMAA